MLAAIQPLSARDVLIGVGAGIGNFLAQVVLTASVIKRICVEAPTSEATIIFANYFFFEEEAKFVPYCRQACGTTTADATVSDVFFFFFWMRAIGTRRVDTLRISALYEASRTSVLIMRSAGSGKHTSIVWGRIRLGRV
ncbi:hypothetical protein PI125_g20383 [Phytophthora idaei]|nr:hypothetical protein PI125_g20383 [Phytophthora idaei]